jgi:hypothetical protein
VGAFGRYEDPTTPSHACLRPILNLAKKWLRRKLCAFAISIAERLNTQSKMFLSRLLDQLRRSQEYWSLSTISCDVADKTVADLRGLRDTLLELEVSYRENQGQNLKPINDLRYSVSQSSHPEAFTDFIKGDTSGVHSICFVSGW